MRLESERSREDDRDAGRPAAGIGEDQAALGGSLSLTMLRNSSPGNAVRRFQSPMTAKSSPARARASIQLSSTGAWEKGHGTIRIAHVPLGVAAALEVDCEEADGFWKVEGDVDSPAQVWIAEAEGGEVWVAPEANAFADREADILLQDLGPGRSAAEPLASAVGAAGYDDGPAVGREDSSCRLGIFDFLQRDHVGAELVGMTPEGLVVCVSPWAAALAVLGSEAFQVPGGQSDWLVFPGSPREGRHSTTREDTYGQIGSETAKKSQHCV